MTKAKTGRTVLPETRAVLKYVGGAILLLWLFLFKLFVVVITCKSLDHRIPFHYDYQLVHLSLCIWHRQIVYRTDHVLAYAGRLFRPIGDCLLA